MTYLFGRAAGRKTASTLFLAALLVTATGCGVKNNLVKPNGRPDTKTERDPSLPPNQTGR